MLRLAAMSDDEHQAPKSGALAIHELSPKGAGIHRSPRGDIYVDRALPGDKVEAKIRRGVDGILRGDIVKVTEASPYRVDPPCRHYDRCGGCTLQHASDEFYRRWKLALVRDALAQKGLHPQIWREPMFLPPGSRRRATFTALKENGIVTLGHVRRRGDRVTAIDSCLVADPVIMRARQELAPRLAPILQEGKPATAFIQAIDGAFEIVITGPVGETGIPDGVVRGAMARLVEAVGSSRIAWRAHLGDAAETVVERAPLDARFGALRVALPPLAFLQPTAAGERALVDAVLAALPQAGHFADLFSGCGTFTGPLLARGAVDAYESLAPAVRALDAAKATLPLKALGRDLFRHPLQREEAARYDAIVFDPPRAGAAEQVKHLAASAVPVLVAVSCNPSTFARDALILVAGGYRLESVEVIDQFAWSHHVELVAAFRKPSAKHAGR
jgi:23S rRNA (uracil1939-C5)-methyltransferase